MNEAALSAVWPRAAEGGPDQARIAWISGPTPMIAITHLRLYANTCTLISVWTLFEGPGLEVGGAHPGLERAEGVLDGGPADAHGPGLAVQAFLHGVDDRLVLPAPHAALSAGRTLGLQRAAGAVR